MPGSCWRLSLRAADAVGLGTCPISVIRDHSAKVSEMLKLPQRVIPVAGMTVGWPSEAGHISARLGLSSTVHEGKYDEGDLAARIDAYDNRRAAIHPYKPRDPARWGEVPFYGWSEDKARQYGVPQRPDFGAFVRGKGIQSSSAERLALHILLHAPVQRVGDEHLAARADRDVMRLAVLAERLALAAAAIGRARCRADRAS